MLEGLKGYLAAAALALAVLAGYWVTSLYHETRALRIENASLEAALASERLIEKTTNIVLSARTKSAKAIAKKASIVQVEIEKRLPDAGLPVLPGSFRVLHDAAATSEVPAPPGGADEAPVTPKEVASTVAGNYETCLDNSDRLQKLQLWVNGVTQ